MKRLKPSGFDDRLKQSIELLQKAESLALKYDPEDGFHLAFSGGKDSQALYHVAQMACVKFKAHMNFTSVDPPQVIMFKRKYYPEVVEHPPKWSIYDRAVERGILPSMRIRWCCADFKESAGAGKVVLIGIRAEESSRRARRHEIEVSNRKFSGNLDQFAKWQKEEIKRREDKLMRKMKREGKKVNEDEFSLEKDNEIRCINGKDSILVSPIFRWTEKDVWYFLDEVMKVPHCELYDIGWKRIGCIMCPMSSRKQKLIEMQMFPHVKRNWIKVIKAIRAGGGIKDQTSRNHGQLATTPPPQRMFGQDVQRPPMEVGRREESPSTRNRRWAWNDKQLPKHPNLYDCPAPAERERERSGRWNRKANLGIWAGGLPTPTATDGRVFR